MKIVNCFKAAPIGSETLPSVTLIVDKTLPTIKAGHGQSELRLYAELYEKEAEAIAAALWGSLPGGVFDHLLAKLMERRACLLRVNFPTYHDTVTEEATP